MALFPQSGSRSDEIPSGDDEFARLVRKGAPSSESITSGAEFPAGKLVGEVPMTTDAPRKGVRKTIAGCAALLGLLRHGFLGVILTALGAAIIFIDLTEGFQLKNFALGAGALVLGILLLRSAYSSYKNLRLIAKA